MLSGRRHTGGGVVVDTVGLMAGAQWEFFTSEARHPALIGGRGCGKTWTFCAKGFALADMNPGIRGVMTQPTFEMIRRNFLPVWERQWGHLNPQYWEYRIVQQGVPSEIAFKNGSVIDLRPASTDMAERFRGATYGFWGMDEVRNEDQFPCFLALMPTLRQPDMPHQGFVTSTPERRRPWIEKIWSRHESPLSGEPLTAKEYPMFRAEMDDNWHLSEADKKHWHEMYGSSRVGLQELRGQFVSLEGIAFEELGDAHIREADESLLVRKLCGLDFGATSPTALLEAGIDVSGRVWVTREFYKRNCDDYDWIQQLADWGHFGPVVCDPSRSEKELVELRRRYGVNLQRATVKAFDRRISLVRNRITLRDGKPNMFISQNCPNLTNELRNLAFAQARAGEFAVDRWESGCLDHCLVGETLVDTLAGPQPISDLKEGWAWGYDGLPHRYQHGRKTGTDREVLRLSLADGRSVTATPDHRFLMADGTWRELQHLHPGELLFDVTVSLIRQQGDVLLASLLSADVPPQAPGESSGIKSAVAVESVAPAGRANVYNISVDDVFSFSINGGIIAHNSFDALAYLLSNIDRNMNIRPLTVSREYSRYY